MMALQTEVFMFQLLLRHKYSVNGLCIIFDGFSIVFTSDVLHFIWTSHIKCFCRI